MNNTQKWIVFIIVAFVVWRLLGKLNLVPTKESNSADNLPNLNALNPNYYKELIRSNKNKEVILKREQYLVGIANAIENSEGHWYKFPFILDNDASAIGSFKELTSKAQISQLADVFKKSTGKDLAKSIDYLDDSSKAQISDYIKNLPTGLKNKPKAKK